MSTDFWKQVDVREMRECWLWQGALANGYGFFRNETAHRFAWSFIYGEVPRGLFILHSCDTPQCVNPRHLRAGTHEENTLDKTVLSRVRAAIAEGTRADHDAARFDIAKQLAADAHSTPVTPIRTRIRELREKAGLTQKDLASLCSVNQASVCHWERGNAAPKRARLAIVARVLGVSIDDLIAEVSL